MLASAFKRPDYSPRRWQNARADVHTWIIDFLPTLMERFKLTWFTGTVETRQLFWSQN